MVCSFVCLMLIVSYADVEWAGYPLICQSNSGFCLYLGDNLISWSKHRVANVVVEIARLHNLILELSCPLTRSTVVFCNNVSVIYLASNLVQHQITKHVEINLNIVRGHVVTGQIRVLHVPSTHQLQRRTDSLSAIFTVLTKFSPSGDCSQFSGVQGLLQGPTSGGIRFPVSLRRSSSCPAFQFHSSGETSGEAFLPVAAAGKHFFSLFLPRLPGISFLTTIFFLETFSHLLGYYSAGKLQIRRYFPCRIPAARPPTFKPNTTVDSVINDPRLRETVSTIVQSLSTQHPVNDKGNDEEDDEDDQE
ncbi:hypothetical protein LXL04_020900 [Taraxacum kok-saghyz]